MSIKGVKTRWHVSLYKRGNDKPYEVKIFSQRWRAIYFAEENMYNVGAVKFETVDSRKAIDG